MGNCNGKGNGMEGKGEAYRYRYRFILGGRGREVRGWGEEQGIQETGKERQGKKER